MLEAAAGRAESQCWDLLSLQLCRGSLAHQPPHPFQLGQEARQESVCPLTRMSAPCSQPSPFGHLTRERHIEVLAQPRGRKSGSGELWDGRTTSATGTRDPKRSLEPAQHGLPRAEGPSQGRERQIYAGRQTGSESPLPASGWRPSPVQSLRLVEEEDGGEAFPELQLLAGVTQLHVTAQAGQHGKALLVPHCPLPWREAVLGGSGAASCFLKPGHDGVGVSWVLAKEDRAFHLTVALSHLWCDRIEAPTLALGGSGSTNQSHRQLRKVVHSQPRSNR